MSNNEKLAKIAINKSLLKEYSNSSNERIVYMNDGTEFQIQIFNPYSYVIGVSFSFNENNNYGNSQLLVLRPGERVWLDRYLDKESKLLFSTYEVGASEEVKKAIQNNGNLCVKFFKEKQNNYYVDTIYVNNVNTYDWDSIKFGSSVCNDLDISSTKLTANYCANDVKVGLNSYCPNTTITAASASTISTSANFTSNDERSLPKFKRLKSAKSIETGRIEEGSHSNQKFQNVYKNFESWYFKIENIKILPTSQKQISSSDLQKRYCHNCGRKLNQKFNYCPFCGAKQ